MVRLKNFLQIIFTLVLTVLISTSYCIFPAYSMDEEELEFEKEMHSVEGYFGHYFDTSTFLYETVDGVDYIYIVNNGEATILNIHIQYRGPEKIVLTLPTTLGGYPVKTIGYRSDNGSVNVFYYIWYGEEIELISGNYVPTYDPGLQYISKVVIPEGYEYIESGSLQVNGDGYTINDIEFPKGLKSINNDFYSNPIDNRCYPNKVDISTGRNLSVLPDCIYEGNYANYLYMFEYGSYIVLPSRDSLMSVNLMDVSASSRFNFYVPSNISFESLKNSLFYYDTSRNEAEWEAWQSYYTEWQGPYSTLHFAADSDIPEQIEALDGDNPYPMICDLPVATHIAFDSDTVSVEVGEVVDLEAKTYPAEAVWTACDYVSSNPEVVKVDPYSGRITALAEGEVTITATHVERGFVDTCTVKVENKPEHICTPAEKWSADETAHWLECTDPECGEIINYAEHSGGNATVNAKAVCEYCGTAYGEYVAASFSVEPVSDIAYCAREKREYKITVAENADKIQFIRESGSTTTFVRSQAAEIINNGDGTETWILAVSLNKGKYTLATKYGKVWNKNGIEFEIVFDTPKCRSFTSEKVGNLTTFTVVTDPQVAKVQLITQSGNTLTYTQSNSYIGEDGLRYWTVVRKITKPGTIGLRKKYGYTWTTTDFTIEV